MSSADKNRKKIGPRISALILIQTVWHSDSGPEISFWKKVDIEKVSKRQQKLERLLSEQTVKCSRITINRIQIFKF